ncbi:K(+)-insensitive pyrophosphate-energized proton pump [Gracilariopsis chorda]|uniref:H(+)-exporting diphosphatase n=1 Tax=Gracilariopsis chorda TaxID=448386 RepID=A0A2V3J3G1_9FLOR|nr:K(+)-insensitive pyrophosphate-energized proton pump [Gracilariopsis chorda]|eukprot:PXF48909.1 K(+)-insensitive pyrophosphate-energized proton pump [Gracilariopsis chorda]
MDIKIEEFPSVAQTGEVDIHDPVKMKANEGEGKVDTADYHGYEPLSPNDYPYDEDVMEDFTKGKDEVNPNMLRDKSQSSKTIIIFISIFSVALIAMLVWQVLIAKCLVTELCEANDKSSGVASKYLFKTFTFRIPTALVWLGLLAGTLGMLVAVVLAFFSIKSSVGSARMVELATMLRKASNLFLGFQVLAFFFPSVLFFVLYGVAVNWETAGSYGIGALLTIVVCLISKSLICRGGLRSAAASNQGVFQGLKLSYRIASVISLAILSTSLLGVSSVYLMFNDIRALTGLVAGTSITTLFLRLSGLSFALSPDLTEENVRRNKESQGSSSTIAKLVVSSVRSSCNTGTDWFESVAASVVAAAILGSSLPFFYRDSFAMCVYNHLNIDQACGPFGYPQALSYAVYICRSDSLYLTYPNLKTWGSNTAFVAIPFLLTAAGLVVSIICTLSVKLDDSQPKNREARIKKSRLGFAQNALVGCGVLIICYAAICFGMFGPNSTFQSQKGLSGKTNLQRMVLSSTKDRCITRSLNPGDSEAPFPVPSGGKMTTDKYRPIAASGRGLGAASSTSWKLFLCCVIGMILGIVMSGVCGLYFTSVSFRPTIRVRKVSKYGTSAMVLQGLGNGVLSSVVAGILIFAAVLASFELYDAYGVGVMTVAYISLSGMFSALVTLGVVGDHAHGIAHVSSLHRAHRHSKQVKQIAAIASTGEQFSDGASVLVSIVLILTTLQQAGLQLSPRELVGGPEQPPLRLISTIGIPLTDSLMICGVLLGSCLPLVVSGMLCLGVGHGSQLVGRKSDIDSVQSAGYTALLQSTLPTLVTLVSPFAVGFGFGHRALIAMSLASVGVSFAVGSALRNMGLCIMEARRSVDRKHNQSTRSAESLARSLTNVVGPAMRSVSKSVTAVSLVSAPMMRPDSSQIWVGGLILGIAVLFGCAFAHWKHGHNQRMVPNSDTTEPQSHAPPKRVSPFFMESPTFDPSSVMPGSQMAEALKAFGSPRMPVSPRVLPGLSRRSHPEFVSVELEPLVSPRVGSPSVTSQSVLPDTKGRSMS